MTSDSFTVKDLRSLTILLHTLRVSRIALTHEFRVDRLPHYTSVDKTRRTELRRKEEKREREAVPLTYQDIGLCIDSRRWFA